MPSEGEPVIEDFAFGFGQIRVRLRGSMTITKSDAGDLSYSGQYDLEVGKDWNFDKGKKPKIFGGTVEISMEAMRVLPKYGYAREFFVTGSRQYSWGGAL